LEKYICIHAHFYQPPRENPWLETIEYQDSAYPYHDWNQRITAECYEPNAVSRILDPDGRIDQIVNNYSRINFDFGPTLLSWLADFAPETYRLILTADKESRGRYSGHGSAIAQGYNHMILPLCNHRDKVTQIQWGIKDFQFRFGRRPESMWLPETAVDLETLDLMAQMGMKFAILAPSQAKRVRKKGERNWHNIQNQSIDPSMAYQIQLPSKRKMALFFYDSPISLAVGFEKLLSDGADFANRLMGAFSADRTWPQIVHIATDGETYGHHHRFGDMALAFALNSIEKNGMARLTNYGEYLKRHPPTHVVEIRENSSWSCAHGVERWKSNCGCNSGTKPGWHQLWREPLRSALDSLRDNLAKRFEEDASNYLADPWAARNNYVDVILDRSPESIDRFFSRHQTHDLNPEERVRALKLMELQRHAMLMYTSCGWFFDEISGIETVQVLQYAGRAIQLGGELFGPNNLESTFLELLEKAPSNVPEYENGRKIYEEFVRPAMVDRQKALGHYAVSSLFQDYPEKSEIYSYFVERECSKTLTSGRVKLALGRCKVTSKVTRESSRLEYAVFHLGDHSISGGVGEYANEEAGQKMIAEMSAAFERMDMPGVFRMIDEYFGQSVFSLKSLFRDEQRRVIDIILKTTNADLEQLNRQAFERTAPLMRFLMDLGLSLPPLFKHLADGAINAQMRHAFEAKELNREMIMDILDKAKFWTVDLDTEGLAYVLRETIENLARDAHEKPGDLESLKALVRAVKLARSLPFAVNFYRTQNSYYDMLKHSYAVQQKAAQGGNQKAQAWVQQFRELGTLLSFKVEQGDNSETWSP
jgi:alpha-amylase/alpha-mannosidase (GH57 family)